MPYLSKKAVLDGITERKKTVKGKIYTTYEAYAGLNPITNQQVRFSRSDKSELKDVVEDFYKRIRIAGDAGGALTAQQSCDALQAIQALSDAKIEMSLLDCVRKLIEYRLVGDDKPPSMTLGDAFAEYLETFTLESDNRRTVDVRVGKWANDFGKERLLTEINENDVVNWISEHYDNPKTYNNHLTYIRTFFNWCMKKNRRYLLDNPLECAVKKPVQAKRPEFLNATETESLLRVLEKRTDKPELLAYAIVSFFCGIRREEILRGSDDEQAVMFDFPHKTVIVVKVKRYTQGAHPRSFPMSKAFMAWAKSFDFDNAFRMIDYQVTDRIQDIARANNIRLPRNAGRHSFITQFLALTHDLQKTCQYAGTSPSMVQNNYNGLSFEDDATAYFALRPTVSLAQGQTAT